MFHVLVLAELAHGTFAASSTRRDLSEVIKTPNRMIKETFFSQSLILTTFCEVLFHQMENSV